jgi:hypothetical protein
MEERFEGQDFSQVRVYTDIQAAKSAHAMNARAYTVGQKIAFGAGEYSPGTYTGKSLLAHELTHVMQQEAAHPRLQRQEQKVNVSTPRPKVEKQIYEREIKNLGTVTLKFELSHPDEKLVTLSSERVTANFVELKVSEKNKLIKEVTSTLGSAEVNLFEPIEGLKLTKGMKLLEIKVDEQNLVNINWLTFRFKWEGDFIRIAKTLGLLFKIENELKFKFIVELKLDPIELGKFLKARQAGKEALQVSRKLWQAKRALEAAEETAKRARSIALQELKKETKLLDKLADKAMALADNPTPELNKQVDELLELHKKAAKNRRTAWKVSKEATESVRVLREKAESLGKKLTASVKYYDNLIEKLDTPFGKKLGRKLSGRLLMKLLASIGLVGIVQDMAVLLDLFIKLSRNHAWGLSEEEYPMFTHGKGPKDGKKVKIGEGDEGKISGSGEGEVATDPSAIPGKKTEEEIEREIDDQNDSENTSHSFYQIGISKKKMRLLKRRKERKKGKPVSIGDEYNSISLRLVRQKGNWLILHIVGVVGAMYLNSDGKVVELKKNMFIEVQQKTMEVRPFYQIGISKKKIRLLKRRKKRKKRKPVSIVDEYNSISLRLVRQKGNWLILRIVGVVGSMYLNSTENPGSTAKKLKGALVASELQFMRAMPKINA